MAVELLTEGQAVGAARGEAVVVIPVFGAVDLFRECLRSVLVHTDESVIVVVADDATPGTGVADAIESLAPHHRLGYLRREENVGFVRNVGGALACAAPADVAVVNSDCVVAAGWLDGLRDAALADSRIATATALSNNGSIVSVPHRNTPAATTPGGRALDDVAASVRSGSAQLRPRIPTAIGHCFYVRRTALELVGGLDPAFSPGYGEEVDFSQRCMRYGLVHVVADDVYVLHRGEGSFGPEGRAVRAAHEQLIERRYPYYPGLVRTAMEAERGPLPDSLGAARRSLEGMSLTIDASSLGPVEMGTQVTVRALARALGGLPGVRLRVVLPRTASAESRAAIETLRAKTIFVDEIERGVERTDVVHRPSQPTEPKQLDWLHRLGERIVITHQDLIGYVNPAYFDSYESFDEHRTLTRQALALADAVVFVSDYVRRDAVGEQLASPERAHVVAQGVDHDGGSHATPPSPAPASPFLLVIGTDFEHKNRVFAMRVLEETLRLGFDGQLVLAGPHMQHGSSRRSEDALLAERPQLRDRVLRLDQVSEAEKQWLYRNAALVLYPTVSEGFGLVPFEAARVGTACMYAAQSSLTEVVGGDLATIVPWDAAATAETVMRLLRDEPARTALVTAIRERGSQYTWDRTARELMEIYATALSRPARAARAIYFGEAISDVALSLVGPGGYLPPSVQRALLAVSTRPALRRPVFAALEASYRALKRRR